MLRSAFAPALAFLPFLAFLPTAAHAENGAALMMRAVESISADELQGHVDVLADDQFEGREAGSRGGAAAGVYVMKELTRLSLEPAGDDGGYFQDFRGGRNILAVLRGSDPELQDEYVVVGGHYDHVGYGNQTNSFGPFGYVHNGADDNASGVAGVLETAEAMVEAGLQPKRSILFAFWDGEEKGLVGSEYFTRNPTISLEKIAFAFNVDMIGNLRDSQLEVFGVRSASGLRRLVSMQNVDPELKLKISWELKANSDHHSFLSRNIPTLMFHTGLHDRYHRPSDDSHTVNRQGMEQVARLLVRTVGALADHPRLPYRINSRFETEDHRRGLELATSPPPPRIGWAWDRIGDQLKLTHVHGPALSAGFQVGDVITRINGAAPETDELLRLKMLWAKEPVKCTLQRDGETLELSVEPQGAPTRIGVTWRQDEGDASTAVVTLIRPGSAAELAGIKAGERIIAIAGQAFEGTDALYKYLTETPAPLNLLLEKNGRVREVELNPLAPRGEGEATAEPDAATPVE